MWFCSNTKLLLLDRLAALGSPVVEGNVDMSLRNHATISLFLNWLSLLFRTTLATDNEMANIFLPNMFHLRSWLMRNCLFCYKMNG